MITGSHSGEFTLWNGLTFNFETILQAHDDSLRCMRWSHDDLWMVTADDGGMNSTTRCGLYCMFPHRIACIGVVKYWQSSMNNVKAFKAHKESVRDISFAPSDMKFASCSDDKTISVWDFESGKEEVGMNGHGWDVKSVHWHPQKSLLLSGMTPQHEAFRFVRCCSSCSRPMYRQ